MSLHYGHLVRILHWCTDHTVTNALEQMELTAAQGHILGFLAHRSEPPCPRDIEEAFQLTHPTVSGLLSRLEKKEFIQLLPDEQDRRCKRIHILPRGRECMEAMRTLIQETEKKMVADFTEAEQAQFAAFLERAITNMGASPYRKPNHKEENSK